MKDYSYEEEKKEYIVFSLFSNIDFKEEIRGETFYINKIVRALEEVEGDNILNKSHLVASAVIESGDDDLVAHPYCIAALPLLRFAKAYHKFMKKHGK